MNQPVINTDKNKIETAPAPRVSDIYESQLRELYEITYPEVSIGSSAPVPFESFKQEYENTNGEGVWVYYPWRNTLLHTVSADDLYTLRTNRNQNLITHQEQLKLRDFTVGCIGLSIGGSMVRALAHQGISQMMKLADFDDLETTNLNRVPASLLSVGRSKLDTVSEQIYELDPFISISRFSNGITNETIDDFFDTPSPDLIFEAIDDFRMKILIRTYAKKHDIPLVMFTNLGDSILIDVERYDLDKDTELFNGLVNQEIIEDVLANNEVSADDLKKYAVEFVQKENVPQRALDSLPNIGKTLVGRPQLMGTVAVSGGLSSYVARSICLTPNELTSGRRKISFSSLLLQ